MSEVWISVSKRAGDAGVYTDVKEVITALIASRKCSELQMRYTN